MHLEAASHVDRSIDGPVDFTRLILSALGTEQYPTPAKRPAYSVFDTKGLDELHLTSSPWLQGLDKVLKNL